MDCVSFASKVVIGLIVLVGISKRHLKDSAAKDDGKIPEVY